MARKIYFSFDYERDRYRVCQIKDICMRDEDNIVTGDWDLESWQIAKNVGNDAIFAWVNKELEDTLVTVVLIGHNSYDLDYMDYAISESCKQGNAILGVRIDKMLDLGGSFDLAGKNPLNKFKINETETLDDIFPVYEWTQDGGEKNFNKWIDEAIKCLEG